MRYLIAIACGALLLGTAGGIARADTARADMVNTDGASVGSVTLTETPHGVLIVAELRGLPPGVHAFHVHAVGTCETPFKSAGGHFNPAGNKHGILSSEGKHAGDMPNIHVGADGSLEIEVLNPQVTLGVGKNSVFDADGSAIVIHAGADDYASDPAGDAGPRIACGVITR